MTGINTEHDFAGRFGVLLCKDFIFFLYSGNISEKSRFWVSFGGRNPHKKTTIE
jgi:hypothetical protein